MRITIESIIKDLEYLQKLYGVKFILILCASIILEHCDWNWTQIMQGILKDQDSIQLINQAE